MYLYYTYKYVVLYRKKIILASLDSVIFNFTKKKNYCFFPETKKKFREKVIELGIFQRQEYGFFSIQKSIFEFRLYLHTQLDHHA